MTTTQPKKSKKRSPSKRTLRTKLLRFFAALLLLYFVYAIVSTQIDVYKQKQTLLALQQQIYEQTMENDELERLLQGGAESEYIERIAREKLGYAAPDERVFIDQNG